MPMTMRQFAVLAREMADTADKKLHLGARAAGHTLHGEAWRTFGDLERLRPLKATTQAQRAAMGYPPNEPLLLTGGERETLGMSFGRTSSGYIVTVGSDDRRLYWQEVGTIHMEPIPLLSVASYIAAPAIETISELIAAATTQGVRGVAEMETLLAMELALDHQTEATTAEGET